MLTGGTGYIGSHAALVLAQAGHGVVLFRNLINSGAEVAQRIARILRRELPLVVGDVRDEDVLAQIMRRHEIDAVMHFAGLKAVGESVAQPLAHYDSNVTTTLYLLRAMRRMAVYSLVFSSSAAVYGEPRSCPWMRHTPWAPPTPTGAAN